MVAVAVSKWDLFFVEPGVNVNWRITAMSITISANAAIKDDAGDNNFVF